MRKGKDLDFARLVGFETLSDHCSKGIDFQEDTLGAKLGAKAGGVEPLPNGLDLRDEVIGAKLGAKVGLEPLG